MNSPCGNSFGVIFPMPNGRPVSTFLEPQDMERVITRPDPNPANVFLSPAGTH